MMSTVGKIREQIVLSIYCLTGKFSTNLYKCSFVVVSSVPVDGLAEQSIKFLQLTDFIAFSLGHHSVQQHLRTTRTIFRGVKILWATASKHLSRLLMRVHLVQSVNNSGCTDVIHLHISERCV